MASLKYEQGVVMRFFLEVDLERGNGSVRWERATARNFQRVVLRAGMLAASVVAVVAWVS